MATACRKFFNATVFLVLCAGFALADQPGVVDASADRDDEPLPAGASARLGTSRLRHGMSAIHVAVSPDGKTLASTGFGPGLRLLDIATGRVMHQFPILQRGSFAVAFSPDSKLLAVSNYWDKSFEGICLLDVAMGRITRRLEGDRLNTISPTFSPDGKIIAGGLYDNTIAIWDVSTGKELRRLTGLEGTADALAFSPNGRVLASGDYDKAIRLWDPATGKELGQLTGHRRNIAGICFSADGGLLASIGDYWRDSKTGPIRVWDVAGRRQLRVLGESERPRCIVPSRDGKTLASGNEDGSISLWDFASGRNLRHFAAHRNAVTCLAFTSGNTLVSTGFRETAIRLWDLSTGTEIRPRTGHEGAIEFLGFSQEGNTLLSASRDQITRTWDWPSGRQREVNPWPVRDPLGFRFAVSADTKTLAVAVGRENTQLQLSDLSSRKELARLEAGKRVSGFALSPQSKVLAWGDGNGSIRIWDPVTKKERHRLKVRRDSYALAFSPDGRKLASGSTDVRAGEQGPTLQLWDVVTGKESARFAAQQGVYSIAFSADGKTLATAPATEGPARLWDIAIGREQYALTGSGPWFRGAMVFSPDGRLLAGGGGFGSGLIGGNNTIGVWETITGKEVLRFTGHPGGTSSLAFTPDGRALLSGGGEGSILVWDITGTGKQQKTFATADLENCWTDLASADAGKAQRAIWRLTAASAQTVAFLQKRLRPVPPPDPEHIRALIAGLGSDRFAVREKAYRQLSKLADLAGPALRKASADNLSLETRKRVDQLLTDLHRPLTEPPLLQAVRAVAVLEHIRLREARELLQSLAKGTPEARFTKEARAALERVDR
jgi:WD40 repeat protein